MLPFAKFLANHRPSLPVVFISAVELPIVDDAPSITYRRLPPPATLPTSTSDPVALLFEIPRLSNPSLRQALLEISEKSTIGAVVIDFFCSAAFEVTTSLNIPTYFFASSGGFAHCAFLFAATIDETVDGDLADLNDFLEIPGCPPIHSSDFPKAQQFRKNNVYNHFVSAAVYAQKSPGVIVNSFEALENRAKEAMANDLLVPDAPTPPAYFVGPFLSEYSGGGDECLRWLDSQPTKSVVFLCFGRRGVISAEQLKLMAIGLENSGHRFLWTVRNPAGKGGGEPELEALLPEGFQERTKGRGHVISTWAPQRDVLSHESVGGFVTHCGMVSVMEAAAAGVPMIGWPLYAEQRMIRVFAVEEMKLALPLEEAPGGVVTAVELERRIKELMESTAGRALRRRAAEMKKSAEAATRENGSSVVALHRFITDVTMKKL
uniref:Glycosyltransferase n=1 Tax=Andrographis paniculata TaxID=175694 RepID=A0A3S7QI87_ANDPA|nr:UDP-glycosyltransferase [Andrographis paniculata]